MCRTTGDFCTAPFPAGTGATQWPFLSRLAYRSRSNAASASFLCRIARLTSAARWSGSSGTGTYISSVTALIVRDSRVSGAIGELRDYPAGAVIVATGGVSYPATGSTGDGYRFAAQAGHTLIEPRGSLVPLVIDDPCCGEMQGLTLKNVTLTVKNQKNKAIFSELGELLFTHFGVSGPLALSASAHMRDFEKNRYRLIIDLKSALDEQKLDARLLRDMEERSNQNYASLLGGLVNRSMIPVIVEKSGIPAETKVHSITREQRHALLHLLKNFELPVAGLRSVTEAIITSGGVKVSEINPKTMESKLLKGLYFAGEVIDVDAYTGGFNLQIAWMTARLAAESACGGE